MLENNNRQNQNPYDSEPHYYEQTPDSSENSYERL